MRRDAEAMPTPPTSRMQGARTRGAVPLRRR
ncbi:hypothetical protein M218_17595 [Burkholderia pseudomallei MSHR338]|nr:hypothetical protein M218_17595 [Burkholderia pseudomallei MSHR338]